MDGITAVREIMAASPTPILMFSSLTHDGAKATLDALDAGALDFLPKKFEDIARNRDEAVSLLQQRVIQIALNVRLCAAQLLDQQQRPVQQRALWLPTAAPTASAPSRPMAAKFRASGEVSVNGDWYVDWRSCRAKNSDPFAS